MTLSEQTNGKGSLASPRIAATEEFHRVNPPRLATANDIRELVQYLKRRPDGANVQDVPQPIKKRIFYPAKIACYEFWGLVNVKRDRLTLTPLGWQFAHSLEPEARAYRDLLNSASFYRGALEWIQSEHIDVLTQDELACYWQKEFAWAFVNSDEKEIAGTIVTFFHLCQAAELGAMTIGKRGQPARLRVWREGLLQALYADPTLADV